MINKLICVVLFTWFTILGLHGCAIPCTPLPCPPNLSLSLRVGDGQLEKGIYSMETTLDEQEFFCRFRITKEKTLTDDTCRRIAFFNLSLWFEQEGHTGPVTAIMVYTIHKHPQIAKVLIRKDGNVWFSLTYFPTCEENYPNRPLCPPKCLSRFYEHTLPR